MTEKASTSRKDSTTKYSIIIDTSSVLIIHVQPSGAPKIILGQNPDASDSYNTLEDSRHDLRFRTGSSTHIDANSTCCDDIRPHVYISEDDATIAANAHKQTTQESDIANIDHCVIRVPLNRSAQVVANVRNK